MYKVVIVDDEDTIVRGISQLLPWEKYDCEVVATASDGVEALPIIRDLCPDILFTDINMPEMDGLTLIAALRSEMPQMQVTILSGFPDFEYAQQAIMLGVSNYILKPSKMADLEKALARMVQALDQLSGETDSAWLMTTHELRAAVEKKGDAENAGNFVVNNVIKYIESNYSKKLTLPEVAAKVYVSQWHLSKLISKNTGLSFNDILNGARIKAAKKLLVDPSLKVKDISKTVGFSDVTHFSRIFKKFEDCSANEYRNKYFSDA